MAEEYDIINKPRHYNRDGAIECIEEMELVYGPTALMYFCLLSAHKYRYRAGLKNDPVQDLEKSDYYMRKFKELKERVGREGQRMMDAKDLNILYTDVRDSGEANG